MPHREQLLLDKTCDYIWRHSVIGLSYVSKTGEWLKTNPALSDILEYTEVELSKMSFQQITHPEDLASDLEMMNRLISGEMDWYPMTKRYITKSGNIVWVKITVNSVKDEATNELMFFFTQIVPINPLSYNSRKNDFIPTPTNKPMTVKQIRDFLKRNWFFISSVTTAFGMMVYILVNFLFKVYMYMQTHN